MKIEINNLSGTKADISFFKKTAEKVLLEENKKGYFLSIVLVDGEKMKEINKRYRKKNKETDVLSFADAEIKNFPNKENSLGEIIICPSQIENKEKEMAKVLIHGILHLLGYDHEKGVKQEKRMMEKERLLKQKIN